jgi:hypothetical protein
MMERAQSFQKMAAPGLLPGVNPLSAVKQFGKKLLGSAPSAAPKVRPRAGKILPTPTKAGLTPATVSKTGPTGTALHQGPVTQGTAVTNPSASATRPGTPSALQSTGAHVGPIPGTPTNWTISSENLRKLPSGIDPELMAVHRPAPLPKKPATHESWSISADTLKNLPSGRQLVDVGRGKTVLMSAGWDKLTETMSKFAAAYFHSPIFQLRMGA